MPQGLSAGPQRPTRPGPAGPGGGDYWSLYSAIRCGRSARSCSRWMSGHIAMRAGLPSWLCFSAHSTAAAVNRPAVAMTRTCARGVHSSGHSHFGRNLCGTNRLGEPCVAWTVTRSVLVPPSGSRAASSRSPVTCGSPAGNGPCPDIRKWAPGWCPAGGSAFEEQQSEKYRHALIAVVSIGVRAGQLGRTDAWLSSHLVSHA